MTDAGIAIAGRVALVTGASGGIGRALVERLLEQGASRVIAADRVAVAHGDPRITPLVLDVTDEAAVAAAAERLQHEVDILVNNAGVNGNARLFAAGALDRARREIAVNYLGTLGMIEAFAPGMVARGRGCIVNLLSFVALVNGPGMASYSASKAAAESITQAARAELRPLGVHVLGVYPQVVDTAMSAHLDTSKIAPRTLASDIVAAIEAGAEALFPGPAAEAHAALLADPSAMRARMAARLGPDRPQFATKKETPE